MEKVKQAALVPGFEVESIIMEATRQVEDELKLEDIGWINLSQTTSAIFTSAERINNLKLSRLYNAKDPLGRQSIRLWTDYSFGSGMTWSTEDETTKAVLEAFWDAPINSSVLSTRGQRMSSDKVLVDGEIFFALFLGSKGAATIRRINPLEITEIITDTDDEENILYYRREWSDKSGKPHNAVYRSTSNVKGEVGVDNQGNNTVLTDEALVYHLTYNTNSDRGNPLLLPALDWIKQYRRFLASRIAIMLALARFAWKTKVKGGQTAVDAITAKTDDTVIPAGSNVVENEGVDLTPIKTETGAKNAYDDARMIKLQIAAAVGIPEQYFGDISSGNLATAKTVELPMMKMFQSYQAIWRDTYKDINEVVLAHANVDKSKWYVDIDFPAIAPEDLTQLAQSLSLIIAAMPEFADSTDVQQTALMALGIDDTQEVLDAMQKQTEEARGNPEVALMKVLKEFRESLRKGALK